MDVVGRILVDGTDPLESLCVNLEMVLIQSLLPVFLSLVVQLFGSLPASR